MEKHIIISLLKTKMKFLTDITFRIVFLIFTFCFFLEKATASVFYVNNSTGDDNNNGLSPLTPFKTIDKLNTLLFNPGDSILFKSGEEFKGMFWVKGSGNQQNPIFLGSYGGSTKPILNGDGYQSCILIYNDDGIVIKNLQLNNENSHLDSLGNVKQLIGFGGAANTWGSGKNVRFGIKVVTDTDSLNYFVMDSLEIHHVFPTPSLSSNIHKGYGIKFETQSDTANNDYNLISNVNISNCFIHHTGHYGIWIKSIGLNNLDGFKNSNITIENTLFEHTGGSGFVPNKSIDVLVESCVFNHTGSSDDSRMWERGSGMWPFDCKNVIAQHNYFMNAHGPADSYGAHIDYGNENVVFQYNYSYNNEGGFVEILGDNINCGYRYNISVNDGYREDPNNTPWDKKGKIFWVSNFCGSGSVRCPSSGSFIYNNTVFVNDSINPEIYFWPNIGDILMYNNIVYVGSSGQVLPTLIQNNLNTLDISHNLFYDSARIDLDTDLINNALWGDPALLNPSMLGIDDPSMYQIQSQSPVIGMGKLISGSTDPLNFLQNNGGMDYFGNLVSSTASPNIGASNHLNTLIENQSKKNKVIAYPTFTIDEVSLKIEGFNGDLSTKIYGTNGKLISTQKGEMISMKKYKKGIYILEVHYNNQMERIRVLKL
ncbi:MAG: right-handed parallel beta-helix repeat-containing protein [Bacteroidota bacterium]|nr:right-handed parallel beta-helix repeat-containing protein [Bacteroidota bacterium]